MSIVIMGGNKNFKPYLIRSFHHFRFIPTCPPFILFDLCSQGSLWRVPSQQPFMAISLSTVMGSQTQLTTPKLKHVFKKFKKSQ